MKKETIKHKKSKGFSILEIIIAIFIFSLVIITATASFAGFAGSRKKAQKLQNNLEDARFAMETMAKNIRMSKIDGSSVDDALYMYNYSQEKCLSYRFNSGDKKLEYSEAADSGDDQICDSAEFSSYTSMISGSAENVVFDPDPSSETGVGKVVISMRIGDSDDMINLETAVSLRDYGNTE